MGAATFVLEDEGDAVAVKLTFSGGFDKDSKAHQAGQMLVKLMDDEFTNLGAPPEKVIEQPGLIVVEGDGARRA